MENRYNHFNEFLKNKFSERTLKICIDGGFTCPNRDGTKGHGGCIFCNEKGSATNLKSSLDISNQVKHFLDYKKERANKFIVYFQNFTNTYAPVDTLKGRYDASLLDERVRVLAIGTRPDCIDEEVAAVGDAIFWHVIHPGRAKCYSVRAKCKRSLFCK